MPTIAYHFTPVSPWTYLGHARFTEIANAAGATVEVMPVDFGVIFPASGGLPLGKRAPQRQAYRLVELRRFSDHLGQPLNLHPAHFPVDPTAGALLITCAYQQGGSAPAMALSGALLRGVWAEQRNISEEATLRETLATLGLPAVWLEQSRDEASAQRYKDQTQRALETGVFGAPSYVLDGEVFWGQDRLDFLAKRLAAAR